MIYCAGFIKACIAMCIQADKGRPREGKREAITHVHGDRYTYRDRESNVHIHKDKVCVCV